MQDAFEVAPVTEEYVPAPQGVQTALEMAPVKLENVPAGHGVQDVAPLLPPYLPAKQRRHEDELLAPGVTLNEPGAHC